MRTRTPASSVLLAVTTFVAGSHVTAEDIKATEVLTGARKAIGGKKLESLKTFSLEAALQRNMNDLQIASEVEILLELPDKYVRSDTSSGGMMAMNMAIGFNGDKPIRPANATPMAGGGMIIRMGPGGPMGASEKLGPEDQVKADKQLLRSSRGDVSRLMLGWFAMVHPAMSAEYTYAGEAESPDGKAHVIDAKNADGFSARLFIDQESKLPLMVTYQGPQPRLFTQGGPRRGGEPPAQGGQVVRRETSAEERQKMREEAEKRIKEMESQPVPMAEFTLYFEEWRDVDGIKFPFKLRRAMSGATNEEWTINKVRVNPKIDARKFEG